MGSSSGNTPGENTSSSRWPKTRNEYTDYLAKKFDEETSNLPASKEPIYIDLSDEEVAKNSSRPKRKKAMNEKVKEEEEKKKPASNGIVFSEDTERVKKLKKMKEEKKKKPMDFASASRHAPYVDGDNDGNEEKVLTEEKGKKENSKVERGRGFDGVSGKDNDNKGKSLVAVKDKKKERDKQHRNFGSASGNVGVIDLDDDDDDDDGDVVEILGESYSSNGCGVSGPKVQSLGNKVQNSGNSKKVAIGGSRRKEGNGKDNTDMRKKSVTINEMKGYAGDEDFPGVRENIVKQGAVREKAMERISSRNVGSAKRKRGLDDNEDNVVPKENVVAYRTRAKEKKKTDDSEENVVPKENNVLNRTREKEKKKKTNDIDKDIVDKFIEEESPSSNGVGLSTGSVSGSVSGSKVGSFGGKNAAVASSDDVASSTSKKVKKPCVIEDSEDSLDLDESDKPKGCDEDSRSESSSEEESDDSEDEDFKTNDSPKSVVANDLASEDSEKEEEEEEEQQQQHKTSEKKAKGRPVSKKKREQSKLNYKEILLNTMLEKGGFLDDTLHFTEENVQEQLPLKFRFEDDDYEVPAEKPEWEAEIDHLFEALDMGRLQSEFGSTLPVGDNENADEATACWHSEGHFRILDEQLGIICKHCSMVFLERKYVLPQFANKPCRRENSEKRYMGEPEYSSDPTGFEFGDNCPTNNPTFVHPEGTVWDIVPRWIKDKMYPHQRDGFEFIWKSVGGDICLDNLKDLPSNGGKGCIMSHAPGTGKTGLSVVFLLSFMKLFPKSRPVVIAPCSMLLTWENEIKNWGVNVPFHNLNSNKLTGRENIPELRSLSRHPKSNELKRLMKMFSWNNGNGILGLSYRRFEKESADERKRKILVKSPGLVILDEGHTPRNEDSLIWKAISRIKTRRRIILSGTPFQNNFRELYNTLCLVSPEFSSFAPGGFRKHGQKAKKKWDSIANSIVNDENKNKLLELKRMIEPFVHVYKGTILLEKLPGLRDTLVYLKLTDLQQKQLDMVSTKKFIERDHLRTLISIHPSLAPDIYRSEAKELELDPSAGVKTRFVSELIGFCNAHNERVIVFSRYLEPLMLIKQQLCNRFEWNENVEVLQMDGKIDPKRRQDRISAFNDSRSEAKVLLASTAACCEGINLVGASRIVLLDVMWNPSTTRQAISRAYRIGQKKVVYVYHLISAAFEADKHAWQARKHRMSELVFSADPEGNSRSNHLSDDIILDAMAENQSLVPMFDRIVQQTKNQQTDDCDPPPAES